MKTYKVEHIPYQHIGLKTKNGKIFFDLREKYPKLLWINVKRGSGIESLLECFEYFKCDKILLWNPNEYALKFIRKIKAKLLNKNEIVKTYILYKENLKNL